ncbi:hypothetical protein ZWY2020_019698 [Hordeum vulgare]|nr:hypothetical protein ZWY2020_019698 [Hordeum vulgare]
MTWSAILQLYKSNRRANVLICAASNSAADHVLEKLLSSSYPIRPSDIFRLNAPSRQYEDVNPDFIRFCFFEDMVFKCPPMRALMRYKIVISTYMSSSTLQAEGDPMQLGPVVFCKQADQDGLGKSYLQRLLGEFEQYHSLDANYVTKLVRNYRCHPAILELPSQLFYEDELIPCKEDEVSSVYDCIDLPNKSFPGSGDTRDTGYGDTRNQPAGDGWGYNQEEPANHVHNQDPSDRGFKHDDGRSSTAHEAEWPEEKPDGDYHPYPNTAAEPQEEARQEQQHVEEGATTGQGDAQASQWSANDVDDSAVQDAYVQKYTFPPGWGDVSSIPRQAGSDRPDLPSGPLLLVE